MDVFPFKDHRYIICPEDIYVPLALTDIAGESGRALCVYIKRGCDHHPHSLKNVKPIVDFVKGEGMKSTYESPMIDKIEIKEIDVITASGNGNSHPGTLPVQPLGGYDEDLPV